MMNNSIIAGALFDFMGWLTSRKERLVLSSTDEASPAVDAIKDFAKMRGLSLDDAQVQTWQEALAQPQQEPLEYWNAGNRGQWEIFPAKAYQIFERDQPLYTTTPPQRTWVGLTDEEIEQGCKESWVTEQAWQSAVWWAEAKLKEKNNG